LHFKGKGKEILAHERLSDVFRRKLGKKKRENEKCDVKFRNFESMTK